MRPPVPGSIPAIMILLLEPDENVPLPVLEKDINKYELSVVKRILLLTVRVATF
jgi:hypothetical protein